MNRVFSLILVVIFFSSCGSDPVRDCSLPTMSYDGCCVNSGGPKICSGSTYYLFENDYLVCSDDSVETQLICKRTTVRDGNRYK